MRNINNNLSDYGPAPFVVNIQEATTQNDNYRTTLWTGEHLQLTLMSIPAGGDIGLEIHPNVDQFLRIEEGRGLVKMGADKEYLDFQEAVSGDDAVFIPAGTWHNLINIGETPVKLYSIYAPPNHPHGTIEKTKKDAESEEHMHASEWELVQQAEELALIGAKAAKADEQLTLEKMLMYAMQEEYLARERYLQTINQSGRQRLFYNLINAEENHIRALMPYLAKYSVEPMEVNYEDYIKTPDNAAEVLLEGIQGEQDIMQMYDQFLEMTIPNDVKMVFQVLRKAAQNHLQALQRAFSFYQS